MSLSLFTIGNKNIALIAVGLNWEILINELIKISYGFAFDSIGFKNFLFCLLLEILFSYVFKFNFDTWIHFKNVCNWLFCCIWSGYSNSYPRKWHHFFLFCVKLGTQKWFKKNAFMKWIVPLKIGLHFKYLWK